MKCGDLGWGSAGRLTQHQETHVARPPSSSSRPTSSSSTKRGQVKTRLVTRRHKKKMESQPQPAGEAQAPSPAASPIPDRRSPSPELPLTMTASAVLSSLPRDATSALAAAGQFSQEKILVRFKPVGAAPSLGREVCKISAAQKFEAVVAYLRRVLKVKDTDSVFLYVNSAFAPSLDEIVGNLHRVSPACLPYVLAGDSCVSSHNSVSRTPTINSSLRIP